MSTEHQTHEERSTISIQERRSRSITELAATIERHRPTVWRELKCNFNPPDT